MKFICEKQNFYEALSNVSRAVATKTTIPALEGIKMKLSFNYLELTGYDLELGIKKEINVESEDCGEIVVNSKLIIDIIRRMPDSKITFESDENLNITITGGMTEYSISAISSQEYPDIPEADKNDKIEISQNVLKNMINQTVFAVSVLETKPILTGELFDIENGIFNLVAIDGYRLAVRTEKIDCTENYHFVVPSKTLNEVSKLLSDNDEKKCIICVGKKHIIFDVSGYFVISRLLEGEFHNYKVSIPTKFSSEIIVKTRELIDCLDRCNLLLNEKNRVPVKFRVEEGKIKITCKSMIGKIADEISADISGAYIDIGFNSRYLLEALKAAESDKVRFQLNGPLSAMKIVPIQGESYTFLVLPVHVKSE